MNELDILLIVFSICMGYIMLILTLGAFERTMNKRWKKSLEYKLLWKYIKEKGYDDYDSASDPMNVYVRGYILYKKVKDKSGIGFSYKYSGFITFKDIKRYYQNKYY